MRLIKIYILFFLALFFSACQSKEKEKPESNREKLTPNIIFILVDDLGWSDLACYGNKFHETPHIDSLAKQGVRFTNAYATSPACSPSRASILTGKYPVSLNLTDRIPWRQALSHSQNEVLKPPAYKQELPLDEVTIAEKLNPYGYATASIGKWHLGAKDFYPTSQGFDLNIAGNHTGMPPSYFYPYENSNRKIPDVWKGGQQGEYLTDRLTSEAIDFIEHNKNSPFFLYLPYYSVHIKLEAKQELIEKYQQKAQQHPELKQTNPVYAAMIETLDKNIGRLTKTLQKNDLMNNTVIFFTSDNGGLTVKEGPNTPATTNAPLRAGKGYLYEGGIRVPLIVAWKNEIKSGALSKEIVSGVDFFPTIMDIVDIPSDSIDGLSISPLLKQNAAIKRKAIYWHYPHYSNQGGKPGSAVRSGKYKLIEFFEDERLELYNLENDKSEQINLIDSLPETGKKLYELLEQWRQKRSAKMPTANPGYYGF